MHSGNICQRGVDIIIKRLSLKFRLQSHNSFSPLASRNLVLNIFRKTRTPCISNLLRLLVSFQQSDSPIIIPCHFFHNGSTPIQQIIGFCRICTCQLLIIFTCNIKTAGIESRFCGFPIKGHTFGQIIQHDEIII